MKWLIGLVLVAAIGATGYALFGPKSDTASGSGRTAGKGFKGKSGGKGQARDAVPVFATPAETADVPVFLDGLGTARALNTVTVQPLADGRLLGVDFKEGQDVKRGDVLARIDPVIYEAQLAQAVAKKAQDEAQLADARLEFGRVSKVGPIATLQKNVDTSRAKVAQFEALVQADQASIDLARTQLGYTKVTAPIDGRTGIRMVDEGNIVRAGTTAGLVVITQVQPIAVLFNLPQQQLPRINAAILASGPKAELGADALAPDGRTVVERGVLRVIDNQVDQTTGTIRLKAEFPNATLALWPGQFVNVRIQVDNLRAVIVVPTAAVQQGPNGPFVYVVTPENETKVRLVKIAAQDERIATLSEGVQAGEPVVTSSFSRIREDASVVVTLQPLSGPREVAPASTLPPPGPEGRKGGGREFGKGGGEGKRVRRGDPAETATPPAVPAAPPANGTTTNGTGAGAAGQ